MSQSLSDLPDACQRVLRGAEAVSLAIRIRVMDESTRTAEDAARACGCGVGQIVKSLVFEGRDSKTPFLFLVSGANRVDQDRVAEVIGEPLDRPSGRQVREITGFAIGGIPPFGHATPLRTYMDGHLLGHAQVFAAAGTPLAIFAAEPEALLQATGAKLLEATYFPAL